MNAPSPLTQSAINNGPVLRALSDHGPLASHLVVAEKAGLPSKNMLRTLEAMAKDGLVAPPADADAAGGWAITEPGRRALLALWVAEGVADVAGATGEAGLLLRHDQMRPNPLQPRKHFDRQELDELKASIVADLSLGGPGVLQNLLVFPADTDGVHVISAGERRWRAVGELIAEGVWPESRRLRAVQRDNTDGLTAFIGLVENGQRSNLTIIEQARAYAELVKETGWSARAAALKTGRDPKTVQQMLQVLTKGDPADIAAHEADPKTHTWEWLRGTVQEHRADLEDGEAATPARDPAQRDLEDVARPAFPGDQFAPPIIETRPPVIGGVGSSEPPKPPRPAASPDAELSPIQRLALVELAYKLQTPGIEAWAPVRKYWLDAAASDLVAHRFVVFSHTAGANGPHGGIPDAGYRWLAAHGYVRDEITDDQVLFAREDAELKTDGFILPFATPWLNCEAIVSADPEGDAVQVAGAFPAREAMADAEREPDDDEDAGQDALDLVREHLPKPGELFITNKVRDLMKVAGLEGPFHAGGDQDEGIVFGAEGEAAVADQHRELPDPIAHARALLIAFALNAAGGYVEGEG